MTTMKIRNANCGLVTPVTVQSSDIPPTPAKKLGTATAITTALRFFIRMFRLLATMDARAPASEARMLE